MWSMPAPARMPEFVWSHMYAKTKTRDPVASSASCTKISEIIGHTCAEKEEEQKKRESDE